jgi:Site-specific recombinases, DNA invertase Pin homologs
MILRPGIQMLLQDAQAGQFDIVLAEALDRISRDQADVATLFKHLKFADVPIITLAEGEISELHVGLKGTMNALFLKDLAAKTHRSARSRRGWQIWRWPLLRLQGRQANGRTG